MGKKMIIELAGIEEEELHSLDEPYRLPRLLRRIDQSPIIMVSPAERQLARLLSLLRLWVVMALALVVAAGVVAALTLVPSQVHNASIRAAIGIAIIGLAGAYFGLAGSYVAAVRRGSSQGRHGLSPRFPSGGVGESESKAGRPYGARYRE